MENLSLVSDVLNVTPNWLRNNDITPNILSVRDLALKVIYVIIGIVGVLDNLFVIVVFIFFVKIADKVFPTRIFGALYTVTKRKLPVCNRSSIEQESPAAVADKPARRLRKVCTVYVRAVGLL